MLSASVLSVPFIQQGQIALDSDHFQLQYNGFLISRKVKLIHKIQKTPSRTLKYKYKYILIYLLCFTVVMRSSIKTKATCFDNCIWPHVICLTLSMLTLIWLKVLKEKTKLHITYSTSFSIFFFFSFVCAFRFFFLFQCDKLIRCRYVCRWKIQWKKIIC